MPPKYKLTYFDLKGLGEGIRFLLSYMEEEFEDIRVTFQQWSTMKNTTPFGKLPMLEEDGKQLYQSFAIARYLGNKAGLAGDNNWENLQIDMIADTINDTRLPISAFFMETNEDIKRARKDIFIKETLPFHLEKLDAVVKQNGGYLANNKLSWVDFIFASLTDFLSFGSDVPDVTADYPNLHALREKIFNLPQIKKWVEQRPKTAF